MTTVEALNLIKVKMGGDDTDVRNVVANASLGSAIRSFNRLGELLWMARSVSFAMTIGTASYDLSTLDGFSQHRIRKMEPRIWYVGKTDCVRLLDFEEFQNEVSYRSTSSGKPQIGTLYGAPGQLTLDLWPTPDAAYDCKALVYIMAQSIDEVPEEYADLIIDRAVMIATPAQINEKTNSAYEVAANAWNEGKKEILSHRVYTSWRGTQGDAEPWIFSTVIERGARQPDSGNLTGV